MSKLLKEQWSRLAFGERNTSITEGAGHSDDEFFDTIERVLTTLPPDEAKSAAWTLTRYEWGWRHALVELGVGELDPDTIGSGSNEGLLGPIPGTKGKEGIKNMQTGIPIGIMRSQHYAENPGIAIEVMKRAQEMDPQGYAKTVQAFMSEYGEK